MKEGIIKESLQEKLDSGSESYFSVIIYPKGSIDLMKSFLQKTNDVERSDAERYVRKSPEEICIFAKEYEDHKKVLKALADPIIDYLDKNHVKSINLTYFVGATMTPENIYGLVKDSENSKEPYLGSIGLDSPVFQVPYEIDSD